MKQSRPLKFSIGLFAGLCASLFPRLVAELTTPGNGEALSLFNQNYLILSIVFSIFIGVVITIFEWDTSRSPKDIFTSALAIPAILSGALNTTATVNDIKKLQQENSSYQKTIQSISEIPILPAVIPEPMGNDLSQKKNDITFSFVSPAYAAPDTIQRAGFNFGVMKAQTSYVVVLDQASSRQEAEQKAGALRQKIPVKILKISSNSYLITTMSGRQNKAEALGEATRLKMTKGLQPSLQEIR
ncbi:hypothetical protein [Desulforhopalus sp. IMCC35007]|uniref:hypothetical protein n=1 Tax=Desulforhopalus sp. IMCC35007 TaxID=2569543 RepID=UPI0010AECA5F|nr:hypothetical protein [Desulforhopalus sp. IMCC35007]TKB10857.1 hypothetical protein FCL48_06435 [Desulforhopalus sp. IMCC35007]